MILHPDYATAIGGCRLDDGCEMIVPDWDNPPPYQEVRYFLANAPEFKVRPWALVPWKRYTGRESRPRN